MTETALNFGPQWLRSLTEPHHPSKPSTKLADYRYGREEMLALFDKTGCKPPEDLQSNLSTLPGLFVEHTQLPLNLMTMTEEENRKWNQGANSETSLKLYRKDPSMTGGGFHTQSSRGRGRGRGGGFYERHRSVNEEDPEHGGVAPAGRGFGRGGSRGFDRSVSERGDRGGWFERPAPGAEADPANGSISPRKGYTRAPYDDWRKPADREDDDGWRSTGSRRWGRDAWRGGEEQQAAGGFRKFGEREFVDGRGGGWRSRDEEGEHFRGGRGSFGGRPGGRHRSRQDSSELPEWANDDVAGPGGEGGSFDASGKFTAEGGSRVPADHHHQWDDGLAVDEEVDPDDLPPAAEKEHNEDEWEQHDDEEKPSHHESQLNALTESLVQNVIEDTPHDDPPQPEVAAPHPLPAAAPSPPQPIEQPQQPPVVEAPPVVTTWFYLDPQGNVQGPFENADMIDWYNAGYFPHNLKLRRSCDKQFLLLGEYTKMYGRIPFTPGPQPPPIEDTEAEAEKQRQQQAHFLQMQMQAQQQLLLQQQMLQMAMQHGDMQRAGGGGGGGQDQQQILSGMLQMPIVNPLLQHQMGLQQQQQPPKPELFGGLNLEHPLPQPMNEPQEEPMRNLRDMMYYQRMKEQQQQQQQQAPQPPQKTLIPQEVQNLLAGISTPGFGLEPPKPPTPPHSEPSQDDILRLLGQHSMPPQQQAPQPPAPQPQKEENYDAIQSLISQLKDQQSAASPQHRHANDGFRGGPPEPPSSIWDLPPTTVEDQRRFTPEQRRFSPERQQQSPSIWNNERPPPMEQPSPVVAHEQQTTNCDNDFSSWSAAASEPEQQHFVDEEQAKLDEEFVKPKSSEKKDKKSRRAEEKRRQREAKKQTEQQERYIPGMEGTVRPDDPVTAEVEERERAQMEALQRLQDEQRAMIEAEEKRKQEQEAAIAAAAQQAKLAPWAKKQAESPVKESGLSLMEIQRLEEEREREARMQREMQEQQMREMRRIEAEEMARKQKNLNWATAVGSDQVKSLAEIQEEEERKEREKQEKERRAKVARQKDLNLSQASVWGNTANLSWATKTASAAVQQPVTPPTQRQPQRQQPQRQGPAWGNSNGNNGSTSAGFWDDVAAPTPQQQQQQQQPSSNNNQKAKNKSNQKKAKEEAKLAAIFKDKTKPRNDFEEWCVKALDQLNAQVDIPTFMAFLNDVESPYDIHDYVKSYIGEGKGPKNFAKEYLERRSRYKNSLKKGPRDAEDDLLTPAHAVNPNDFEFQDVKSKKNNRKGKSGAAGGKKLDASHLLGFSVQSDRVNAGEIEIPQ